MFAKRNRYALSPRNVNNRAPRAGTSLDSYQQNAAAFPTTIHCGGSSVRQPQAGSPKDRDDGSLAQSEESGKVARLQAKFDRVRRKSNETSESQGRLESDQDVMSRVNAKEAEVCYFRFLPQIREIAYSTLRRFRPHGASASTNMCTPLSIPLA